MSQSFPAHLPPLLRKLHVMREEVGAASVRIIDTILANPEEFLHWTIADLSAVSNSSEATVVRLVQGLGFRSYQEFKLKLSRTLASSDRDASQQVIQPFDAPEQILQKVFESSSTSLSDTLEHLEKDAFAKTVDVLSQARRIEFLGVGASAIIAQDAHQKFLKLGLLCGVHTDTYNMTQVCALLEPADVAFAISYSGNRAEVLNAAKLARDNGAQVIALSGLGRTPLSRLAHHTLTVSATESPYRPEHVASRLAQLCIVDALVASLHVLGEPFSSRRINKIDQALKKAQERK
ncbi:MurR/RpiR family transcriptional regulator [Deinococcus cellulosilyticus]|uniref:RpiR family transcriptional regulator n=1 Tax=Deinococcus cellulosilyticus (strain DSM 18568 / NBRC 106333 / KACC 11606 / 5516J-15) TaxID=1223518 RepID=A0A511N2R0_DEIC1|nr:MurR/RpiR family transcriptional regulator [Deinococcus cellulosilyticus]GEM46748.1 RpiR family transcriptional regulator [Deinococcus cellulosilyticus NBRC 106333 = KACC 11606]